MSARETLLAELEANRRELAEKPSEILVEDLCPGLDDVGYNPYDNPGHAKPLDVEKPKKLRR